MEFRKARKEELTGIFTLYRSVAGRNFSVWDDDYPGWPEIHEDYENGTLYVMTEGNTIVGAISIVVNNELDALPYWKCKNAREIARVAVAPGQQGKGIGAAMVQQIAALLRGNGTAAIHLLAAEANLPAQAVYRKCGFQFLGKTFMFGHDNLGCELILENL